PPAWPKKEEPIRFAGAAVRNHEPPPRLHDQEAARHPEGRHPGRGPVKVATNHRTEPCRDDRRRCAWVLTELPGNLARDDDRDPGQRASKRLAEGPLMGRLDEAEEERDGDGRGTAATHGRHDHVDLAP